MAKKQVNVAMILEKECKSCNRYKAKTPQDGKMISTVYINHAALTELDNPEELVISIAAG